MTATPHYEPDQLFQLAQQKVQQLKELTSEIQTQVQNPSLPILSQLMFQRETLLSELIGMGLHSLPSERLSGLIFQLEACQTVDPQIESQLRQIHQKLDDTIRQLKNSQNMINRYKISSPTESSSQSQNA